MEGIKKYSFSISLLLLIVFIVLLQILSYKNIQNLKSINANSIAYLKQSNLLTEIKSNMASADDLNTKIIYENKNNLIPNYTAKIETAKKNIKTLKANNTLDRTEININELQNYTTEYITKHNQILYLLNNNQHDEALKKISITDDIILLNKIEDLCDVLINKYSDKGIEITEIRNSKINYLNYLSWGLTAILILLACLRTYNIIKTNEKDFILFQKLKNTEAELNKSLHIKDQFMANMSHEIRTPINIIIGFTNRLSKTNLDENQTQYANAIRNSSKNLLHIVNDILDFSKIQAGMMRFENATFSLPFLLQSVQDMFVWKCKEKNVQLSLVCDDNVPNFIIGDSNKLAQILINLLGNAIKFTHKGEIKMYVQSKIIYENKVEIQIKIADTGIGIAPDKIETVFERFEQAEHHTSSLYGGTGLGLSIVKQITEALNGSVYVVSKPNEGSTFTITIPYVLASNTVLENKKELATEHISFSNNQVLLVEDNPLNIELMEMLLSDYNIQFQTAVNGEEAIKFLEKNTYQLILMDIQMPIMNGHQTTEYIRGKMNNQTPIVALTAHALEGEKEKCLAIGMNDYLTKPVDENILMPILKKYLHFSTGIIANNNNEKVQENKIINLDYLKNILKNNQTKINAIIENYIKDVPKQLQLIEDAITTHYYEDIQFYAHRMLSSLSLMGMPTSVVENIHQVELTATAKNNLEEIQQIITKIKPTIVESIEEAKINLN